MAWTGGLHPEFSPPTWSCWSDARCSWLSFCSDSRCWWLSCPIVLCPLDLLFLCWACAPGVASWATSLRLMICMLLMQRWNLRLFALLLHGYWAVLKWSGCFCSDNGLVAVVGWNHCGLKCLWAEITPSKNHCGLKCLWAEILGQKWHTSKIGPLINGPWMEIQRLCQHARHCPCQHPRHHEYHVSSDVIIHVGSHVIVHVGSHITIGCHVIVHVGSHITIHVSSQITIHVSRNPQRLFSSLKLGFGLGCMGLGLFCDGQKPSRITSIRNGFEESSIDLINDARSITKSETITDGEL